MADFAEDRWGGPDGRPEPEPLFRDDRIRNLVDQLPADEAHMVSRVYFGGIPAAHAGEEIGLDGPAANGVLRDAVELLKRELELDASGEICSFEHDQWGRCQQRPLAEDPDGLCRTHRRFAGTSREPDRYWHEKVVKGHITPTSEWMSGSELHAIINGRYRGDGRRIDQYVTGEPLLIDQDALNQL